MHWIELVKARIWHTLLGAGMPQAKAAKILSDEMEQIIKDTEAGRQFGQPEDSSEGNRHSRIANDEEAEAARKVEKLKHEARKWGGWEPWL